MSKCVDLLEKSLDYLYDFQMFMLVEYKGELSLDVYIKELRDHIREVFNFVEIDVCESSLRDRMTSESESIIFLDDYDDQNELR